MIVLSCSRSAFSRSAVSRSAFSRSLFLRFAFSRSVFSRSAVCGLRFRGLRLRELETEQLVVGWRFRFTFRFRRFKSAAMNIFGRRRIDQPRGESSMLK